MNDLTLNDEQAPIAPPPKAKRGRKPGKRRASPPPSGEPPAPKRNEFAGVTATKCCDDCTEAHCLISTVGVCKHPLMSGDSGCGPVTLRNRETVKRILKRQKTPG